MGERPQWRGKDEAGEKGQLFVLASELAPGVEGRRQRLEEKEKLLLSAGVVFPSEDSWREKGMAVVMMAEETCEIPGDYGNLPVTPSGATEGSTEPVGWL